MKDCDTPTERRIVTPEDLVRRRPVWDAMSGLFLDTEVRWEVPFVARSCAESGYDDGALEHIFWVEVFPEAIGNMLCVAGEWAGLALNEAALVRRANAGKMPWLWLRRRLSGWMVESEWRSTCTVTQWLRPLDKSLRTQFVDALHLCSRYYFETPGEWIPDVWEKTFDAGHEVLADAWQRYEPVCRSMLLDDEAPTHNERVAAVRRLLKRSALDSPAIHGATG